MPSPSTLMVKIRQKVTTEGIRLTYIYIYTHTGSIEPDSIKSWDEKKWEGN